MSLRIISKHINPKLLGIPGFDLIQGLEMEGRGFGKKELPSGSWDAPYGVAQSWTRLKWLSSSSSYSEAIATAPPLKLRVPGEGRRRDRRQTRKIEQAECQVKSSFNLQERRKGQKTEVTNSDLLGDEAGSSVQGWLEKKRSVCKAGSSDRLLLVNQWNTLLLSVCS